MKRCPLCHKLPSVDYDKVKDRWTLYCDCIPVTLRCDGHHLHTEAVACWNQYVAGHEGVAA